MRDRILLKLGELVLKGLNRRQFEERLTSNITRRLAHIGKFSVRSKQSIVYIEPLDDISDLHAAYEAMKTVFGVAALSYCRAAPKEPRAVLAATEDFLGEKLRTGGRFKVECKRADKTFPMDSIALAQYLGGELHEAYPALVPDMHTPEMTIWVEIREDAAFIHMGQEPGAGGLPVGTSGRAAALLSGGIDSPVAAYMMAKRGLAIEPIHFYSYPYTSPEAKDKVLTLAQLLTPWTGRVVVHVVPFTAIQEELRRSCPEGLFTLLMRRFMMRISEKIALGTGSCALITGESLGQVASQTADAMACTESVVSLPVFRPLIGMDKQEIVRLARRIGTFETSSLPYEDCCTVFTPRHPRLRPTEESLLRAEAVLDVEGMVKKAAEETERVAVKTE